MNTFISRILFSSLLLSFGLLSACQNTATNTSVNTNATNTKAAVDQNANKPVENKAENTNTSDPGSTGSLATPTEAYKTAYEIRKRKDAAGLKKVMSKDVLEFFEEMGKIEKKSLEDMLKELVEKPQGPTNETRNEKITGNRAILEYKNEKGEWKEMDFEKEGSEWKMTIPKADGPGSGTPPKKP